ncbi:uncharacterized protein J3R85_005932 [Psidium guajava]|nr:uncharacterized protein J3R85_005932 [Psidium guajava]
MKSGHPLQALLHTSIWTKLQSNVTLILLQYGSTESISASFILPIEHVPSSLLGAPPSTSCHLQEQDLIDDNSQDVCTNTSRVRPCHVECDQLFFVALVMASRESYYAVER